MVTTKKSARAAIKRKPSSAASTLTQRAKSRVTPDVIDFRDRIYAPPVASRPPAVHMPKREIPILDQGQTSACTGFALASVAHWLLGDDPNSEPISPFMLYSMARRYDEFPGSKEDAGSSLRGALKGWHRHGAASKRTWPKLDMPPVPENPQDDWWGDAMRRPLGAYYRVDIQSIGDMHVAINEVGILYASVACHDGWDTGYALTARQRKPYWEIPHRDATPSDGGHAFVIVGYTDRGFIVQNSWGKDWGSNGQALLTYQDWRENAMDCWVIQMGVVTSLHLTIAETATLRKAKGKIEVSKDEKLRNHEIAPYVVNMENNGRLSNSGVFRTTPDDLKALVTTYLRRAREDWGLKSNEPADIAIYAHGGLVSESDAAAVAAEWIPALYQQKIFPIFLMWETDLISTLGNMVKDGLEPEDRRTAGIQRWWDERLEKLLAKPGTAVWGEMKENGTAISKATNSGGALLYKFATASQDFNAKRDRIHLIGHSAGSIVHCHLVELLAGLGWNFSSANMMAPAATVDLFASKMLPYIRSKQVTQYNQWHLSDALERNDKTCRAILGYGRSLLYLVSESFEGGARTPVLGMEKYYSKMKAEKNMRSWTASGSNTQSTTHGGFDNDPATLQSVLRQIRSF